MSKRKTPYEPSLAQVAILAELGRLGITPYRLACDMGWQLSRVKAVLIRDARMHSVDPILKHLGLGVCREAAQ